MVDKKIPLLILSGVGIWCLVEWMYPVVACNGRRVGSSVFGVRTQIIVRETGECFIWVSCGVVALK